VRADAAPSTSLSSGTTNPAILPKPPTMNDFEQAFNEIKAILPQDCISTDREDLIQHGSSSWTYHDPKVLPGAVLFPRNTDDVRSF
jgi:D-lactate dehydrogenase (cytochrome)